VTGIRLPEIYIDNANFGGKAGKIKRNNPAKGFGPKGNEDVKFSDQSYAAMRSLIERDLRFFILTLTSGC